MRLIPRPCETPGCFQVAGCLSFLPASTEQGYKALIVCVFKPSGWYAVCSRMFGVHLSWGCMSSEEQAYDK
eukprot:461434-Pelagomonas_calceolata.AAC.6